MSVPDSAKTNESRNLALGGPSYLGSGDQLLTTYLHTTPIL